LLDLAAAFGPVGGVARLHLQPAPLRGGVALQRCTLRRVGRALQPLRCRKRDAARCTMRERLQRSRRLQQRGLAGLEQRRALVELRAVECERRRRVRHLRARAHAFARVRARLLADARVRARACSRMWVCVRASALGRACVRACACGTAKFSATTRLSNCERAANLKRARVGPHARA
jgi:hypothetical protein